ncbi:MAG: thioredoxin domain-containing protein [Thermoleophilaceae bacterium]|nr:thioredoxin domain-containing protein [Thermoleophilaceae bacterium]
MPNRLAQESSPYLLQHADNPVDWYPWGPEALALAAERDVPILLSVGYSSCHWCHVMAHESFEDAATASYMNEHFVNIKVDREERPDIDAIYMEAAQAMSGHGGWPLTAFLTPHQVPFFAGTYFPPESRPNMPSFMQLMESIVDAWVEQRDAVDERSEQLIQQLSMTASLRASEDPISAATLDAAAASLHNSFDVQFGGFGGAPKFPPHSVLEFLLGRRAPEDRELALETLRKMAAGGIHDQIGGGFSRYSVDARWHIPHFEKMLYDNALLARSYLHAWQLTGDDDFASVCRTTLDWMLGEMQCPEGGFASALDADSIAADGHLEEGAYYAWEIDELREIIESVAPGHVGDFFLYWGVIDHGEFDGKNVLFVNAAERKPDPEIFEQVRGALWQRRQTRSAPARDDKRIASWNALAVAALAEAGAVLDEPRYSEAAVRCAEFIERELALPGGRMRRSWTESGAGPAGYLEDHAYCAAAWLTLYEMTGDERWFVRAREISDAAIEHFEDADLGGFFTVAGDHERLLVRRKDVEDNPIPSGNSAIALALQRLAALTGDQRCRESADRCLKTVQQIAGRLPLGFGHALQAIDFHLGPVREIALVGPEDSRAALRAELLKSYMPRAVVAACLDSDDSTVELLRDRGPIDGRAAAFVCENFSCELPVTDAASLRNLL